MCCINSIKIWHSMTSDRILFYGGTFDPPHNGHIAALKAAAVFINPSIIYVIPSYVSPGGKKGTTPFYQRLEMCRCFRDIGPQIIISGMERTGHRRKSYTLTTLKKICRRHPGSKIYMLIGSDKLHSLYNWKGINRILSICVILVVSRPGENDDSLIRDIGRINEMGGKIEIIDSEMPEISSDGYRAGENGKNILPAYVENYIEKTSLYGRN